MKLLLYCTKSKPLFLTYGDCDNRYYDYEYDDKVIEPKDFLNGKIVAECDFEVEEIEYEEVFVDYMIDDKEPFLDIDKGYYTNNLCPLELQNASRLTFDELDDYLERKVGYAIHIKNLHIFDEPKRLNDYYQYTIKGIPNTPAKNVQKAPQNMMRVFSWRGDDYILISIRPEWLCKILNGEKTIEVRRKILQVMKNEI